MLEVYSKGYAVVVGVGGDLPVTLVDAEAVANLLRDPSRCAYPKDQVRLLRGKEAGREQVITALEWLGKVSSENDTALVYFSGHGIETPDYFLIPDAFSWRNIPGTAISGEEFTNLLCSIKSRKLLVLLDCCHAGGQADVKEFTGVKSPLPANAVDELQQGSGRVVIASSRKDEISLTGKPYSQFTMAVLEALAGHGAFERDGYARVMDLALYVGRVVPNRTGDRQHPMLKLRNLEENFALAWYAGGDQSPKALEWKAAPPALSAEFSDIQVETWYTMLKNYRTSLILIEERMSEFVLFTEIPLQYVREKRQVEGKIRELERRLEG